MTMVFVTACGNKNKDVKKDNLNKYTIEDSKQFDVMEIKYNGKVYRPFAAAKPSDADTIIGYFLGKACIRIYSDYGEIPYYGNIVLIVLLIFFLPNADKIGGTLGCLTLLPVKTCRIQLAWIALLKVLLDYFSV